MMPERDDVPQPTPHPGPSNYNWARRYVEGLGWAVVPLWTAHECADGQCPNDGACGSPGKHPRVNWRPIQTVTVDDVDRWWTQWPDAGIGILTGARSGIDVIDVDPKNGGDLDTLHRTHPDIPNRYSVHTSGGGGHIYIAHPGYDTSNAIAEAIGVPGVDYRGDGGMVVAPPTIHHTGAVYDFATLPPTPIPTPQVIRDAAVKRSRDLEERARRSAELAEQLRRNPPATPAGGATRFGQAMLTQAADKLADAAGRAGRAGGRHDTLVQQAVMLGGLIPSGHVTADAARQHLTQTARRIIADDTRDREIDDAVNWGLEQGQQQPWEPDDDDPLPAVTIIDAPTQDTEAGFWQARQHLNHLHQFARARRASPWAVLGVALARIITTIPPHYMLPPIIGGPASLNLFVGIVAPSGGGKGAAEAAAADALITDPIHTAGVGSGEGILHQYVTYIPPKKGRKGEEDQPGRVEQHNDKVLFTAGEVDTLGALQQRQASTLMSELRKVWMGEELSFAYVDPTKRLKVEKHHYRGCLTVGIQPARAHAILDDADGGTPQRFLWLPGNDPDMPDHAPPEPPAIPWTHPAGHGRHGQGDVRLDVCDTATRTIVDAHIARNRGDGDALDGHALLCQLKTAAALALLDGRTNVDDTDWDLAAVVAQTSAHTRSKIVAELDEKKRQANRAKGIAEAEREHTQDDAHVQRISRRLMRKVAAAGAGGVKRGDLRGSLNSRERSYYEQAIDRLVQAGQVEVDGPLEPEKANETHTVKPVEER